MFKPLTCWKKHVLHVLLAKSGKKVSGILLPTGKKLACLDLEHTTNSARSTAMVILDVEHLNRQYVLHKGFLGSNLFWLKITYLFVLLFSLLFLSSYFLSLPELKNNSSAAWYT